jgi:hypothetical protein
MTRHELITRIYLEYTSGDESQAAHMADVIKISDETMLAKFEKMGIRIEKIGNLYFVK